MTISVQQLRSAIPGAQPSQLDPGQVAFNVSDGTMYLGTGSDVRIDFSGTTVLPNPPAGKGWIQVLLERAVLNDFFVSNPESNGRPAPTNEQVLTWNSTLSVAEWQDAGTGFAYTSTNSAVVSAIGATTSEKISAAIGNPSYIGQNATCIVTGDPGDTYEGLYIWSGTQWNFASHYAFNTASQVPATNPMTSVSGSTQGVLNALKAVDDGLQSQVTSNDGDIAILQGQMATAQTDINALEINKLNKASNVPFAGQILSFDGTGQLWVNDSQGDVTSVTGSSPIEVDNADPQNPVITLPSNAEGDILVGNGAGTFGPLGVGAEGQILIVSGGVPSWASDSPGDVTSVSGTAPITVDNTDPQTPVVGVDLATTATPGVVQVELTGNLTLIDGVINVPDASTTVKGAVSLNNTLGSSSTTEALTAAQGANLQGQIDALTLSNSVILAGGYDADTGLVDGVTSQGTLAGFVDGSAPPAAASGNVDHYLICIIAGNIPSAMQNGDWLLSVETSPGVYAYQVLGVGARPASASYTTAGIVQLADAAAVLAGTSDTLAITPQSLQDNVIDSVTTVNSSLIASATAVKTANDNALAAATTADAALPKAGGTMTGNITFNSGQIFPVDGIQLGSKTQKGVVQVGTNINVSVAGVISVATAAVGTAGIVALSDAVTSPFSSTAATSNAVRIVNETATAALPRAGGTMTGNITFQDAGEGVIFNGGSSIFAISDSVSTTSSTTAASATAVKAAADTAVAAQSDAGQALLDAAAAQATADAAIPDATFTTAGQLLYGTGAGTYSVLPIGTNGQSLIISGGNIAWGASLEGYTNAAAPFNTALGANAGNSITSGTNNVTIGHDAGTQISTGLNNVFVGFQAGDSVTTGGNNIVIGAQAMAGATTASNNIAIGYAALGYGGAGSGNTALGLAAGANVTTGTNNTFIAQNAGDAITTGSNNIAIGFNALTTATTVSGSVAIGNNALTLATGTTNIAIGANAGSAVTTGTTNLLVGNTAGDAITTGSNNTIIGDFPGVAALADTAVISTGTTTKMVVTATNTSLGTTAGDSITTGANNVVMGVNAGTGLTTGSNNTILGANAGDNIAGGVLNTFIGSASGGNVSGGYSEGNTALGYGTMSDGVLSGNYNTVVGTSAGQNLSSGGGNVFVGFSSGAGVTTGIQNTIIGRYGGTATLSNNVVLSDGAGTIRLQLNSSGALAVNGAGNYGTAGQILMSNGTGAAPTWNSSAALLPNYGSFLSTVSQTNLDTTNGNAATFNTTTESRNVSIVDGTKLTVASAGTYNIQFSAQVTKTDAGSDDINIWFKKNGVNVDNSTSNVTLVGNNTPQLAAVNFILTLAANDYVEIWWWSLDTDVQLLAEPAAAPYPAIPSIIATVVPVGA